MTKDDDTITRLRQLAHEGLEGRYSDHLVEPARLRLDRELEIIHRLGLSEDFLALGEIRDFARQEGTPCRLTGAGCSSLVCFSLRITDVEPLGHGLNFERLCDSKGTRTPTFTFDIAKECKSRLAEFVIHRFGDDFLNHRLWLSGMADLATVPFRAVKEIQKHRAAPFALSELFTSGSENAGDQETFELIRRGDVAGIFQLDHVSESHLLRDPRLESVDEIAAITAISVIGMDGPDLMPEFTEKSASECLSGIAHDAEIRSVVSRTRGLILYQEQVMLLLHHLGGLDLSDAYLLVRAAAKRKTTTVDTYRDGIIRHAGEKLEHHLAETLLDTLLETATYACCKSHHVANALTTYQAAFLKTHFPAEFASALDAVTT